MPKFSPAQWKVVITALAGAAATIVHAVAPDWAWAVDLVAAFFTGGAWVRSPGHAPLPERAK